MATSPSCKPYAKCFHNCNLTQFSQKPYEAELMDPYFASEMLEAGKS